MKEQQAAILAIASRILSYPSDSFVDERESVLLCIEKYLETEEVKKTVKQAVYVIYRIELNKLQETYVETFDLQEHSSLYLTAHEFGDSPKRGAALIQLQKLINKTGFEIAEKELVDFMPMLFEWLAITDENLVHDRLKRRLTYATQRIFKHLSDENPYKQLFSVLLDHVFGKMSNDAIEKLEQKREEADLEELPYPIMYRS